MYCLSICTQFGLMFSAYNITLFQVKACELKILSALNFNVTRPHSLHFLRRNSKAGDANQEQHNLAKFLMECTIGRGVPYMPNSNQHNN